MKTPADQITKSFNLTVIERIIEYPKFRKELLKQVIELVSSDDLMVAQIMLSQVIEADEGVDR
jgi:serine protease inhibitor ecotin